MAIEEVLSGKRYKRKYRDHQFYVVVAEKDGKIWAIQPNVSDPTMNRDPCLKSNIEWQFRGASLAIRKYGAEQVLTELENCSYSKSTIPALIAGVIREWHGTL